MWMAQRGRVPMWAPPPQETAAAAVRMRMRRMAAPLAEEGPGAQLFGSVCAVPCQSLDDCQLWRPQTSA
jgi:hypothetical protein